MTRWQEFAGDNAGEGYAERMREFAASGAAVHGEADRCDRLTAPGSRILDAGCGTGRVAIELARRGHRCVGVDLDASMLAVAGQCADVEWHRQDLAELDVEGPFDLIVAAGNVIPLLAPGTEAATLARLAAHLRSGGVLVTGFGLDAAHLPLDEPPFGLGEFDDWCASVGLGLAHRWATWDGDPYVDGGGYVVNAHTVG